MTLKDIHDGQVVRRSYWSEHNFFVGGEDHGATTFHNWHEFAVTHEWANLADDDTWEENLICGWRMDFVEDWNEYQMIVYAIHVRKGIFVPLIINHLTDSDAPGIAKFIDDVRARQNQHWSIFPKNG